MENWNRLSSSFSSINIGQSASKLARGIQVNVQVAKERLGQVGQDELTELPPEYKELEARVDALRAAHVSFLKIAKVYQFETYDYPTQIQESIADFSTTVGTTVTNFAAANLQGTNLPAPAPVQPKPIQHKTLPHALYRASLTAVTDLSAASKDDKLTPALTAYGAAWEKIAAARLQQDEAIRSEFLQPWQQTLSTNISVAIKARQAVRTSRLELDAAKQIIHSLKSAGPAKQEAARIEVENAEDDLVQKTEVAIQLMKTVLDNPEPIKNLNELIKAQLVFHATTAEALSAAQGEIEELSVSAEASFRKSRDH
ncbi:BAR domain-containing family protein [Thelephora terrestris]|uniref:BAR domain-containing family protein n=1 Tax=Thelephora terrestris TaxID=56493 RepID=A0A9P6H9U1_9AGAM|nr:BAR domain-containing family protein [Thelephora terrestris]